MKNTKRPGWSRLDNAAKVFPALANKKDSRVFRFACQLTEPVQKKAVGSGAGVGGVSYFYKHHPSWHVLVLS